MPISFPASTTGPRRATRGCAWSVRPERSLAVQQDHARAEGLGGSSALLVALGALDGAHGRPAMKAARWLVEEGLAHAAASDVHTAEDQRPVAAGMAWIRKRLGAATLDRLLEG